MLHWLLVYIISGTLIDYWMMLQMPSQEHIILMPNKMKKYRNVVYRFFFLNKEVIIKKYRKFCVCHNFPKQCLMTVNCMFV